MACEVQKDCKQPNDIKRRGFDLSFFCAAKWEPGTVVALGSFRRPVLLNLGGEQGVTGYEYEAIQGGQTGEDEPAWPTSIGETVTDGSVIWECAPLSINSLAKNIASAGDVTWLAESPMTTNTPVLINTGGVVAVSANHVGGAAGTKRTVIARVTFNDGTREDFEILWTISR